MFKRQNDFKQLANNPAKSAESLLKKISFFGSAQAPAYSNKIETDLKIYSKTTKAGNSKIFYLSRHEFDEYFALEILRRLGFITPKCRFSEYQTKDFRNMTQSIPGYVPIIAFRHDLHLFSYLSDLLEYRQKYKLDIKNQVVIDLTQSKSYKISGNLFSTNIGALLVKDTDYGPNLTNIGLVQRGNRFYAAMIDKDCCLFDGTTYKDLVKIPVFICDSLYDSVEQDQILSIIYEMTTALAQDESGQADFYKIFTNSRVMATPILAKSAITKCANLRTTAVSIVEHYTQEFDDKDLKDFINREITRKWIANKVIRALPQNELDEQILRDIIIEDLRAPYYKEHFINTRYISSEDWTNELLVNALVRDLADEFNLPYISANKCERPSLPETPAPRPFGPVTS